MNDDTPAIGVGPARNGLGLFSARRLRAGEVIARISGRVVHYDLLWEREGSSFSANCLRFGAETYLDPGDGIGRFLNHSCQPNAGIRKHRGGLYLFAALPIEAGSEIVIDYSTTIGDDDIWTMRCRCGAVGCRRVIRSFGSLPAEVRRRYVMARMVPAFILRTLDAKLSIEG